MIDPIIPLQAQTPIFLLKVDGKTFPSARVMRIEVSDEAGFESDELRLVLDDAPPQIARPREGAQYELSLGFREWGPPIYVGTYIFEEIERNGYQRTLTLIAKAADHAKTLKEPKTRPWEAVTFGDIAGSIAQTHGLKLAITKALAQHHIPYAAQTEESDQNFLTRLGRRIGAVVAPKDGHLLVTERRSGKTASGRDLPTIIVNPMRLIDQSAYWVRIKPRSRFGKVIARWQDRGAGRTRKVTLETGREGPSTTLRETFQSEAEATKAADAKVKELRAGEGELSVTLVGDPKARAEAPILVLGVAPDADGEWIASAVRHVWDYAEGGGATTTIEAEFGMEEKDDKDDANKKKSSRRQSGEYVSILDR